MVVDVIVVVCAVSVSIWYPTVILIDTIGCLLCAIEVVKDPVPVEMAIESLLFEA